MKPHYSYSLIAGGIATAGLLLTTALSSSRAADPLDSVTYLDQGWTQAAREKFYFTSQGSEMIPYHWFLALEQTDNETLFSENLNRFGFVPGLNTIQNPDHLPMGFVPNTEKQTFNGLRPMKWLGLTCAACHTGMLRYRKNSINTSIDTDTKTIILDGGSTNADFGAFVQQLAVALSDTRRDPDKFARFAARVLGSQNSANRRQKLRTDFNLFVSQFIGYAQNSKPTHDWGPGRVDAFGTIFNVACSMNLGLPQNSVAPNAPVSYPFLWNISRQDNIQWSGEVPNRTVIERMARNMGEVVGVFAHVDVQPGRISYRSSINRSGLLTLDYEESKLTAPKWPAEILGELDPEAVSRGAVLYQNLHCGSCHADLTATTDRIKIKPIPLSEVGTDPDTTNRVHLRIAQTGSLQGRRKGITGRDRFGATASAGDIARHEVIKSLIDPRIVFLQNAFSDGSRIPDPSLPFRANPAEFASAFQSSSSADRTKFGYEARPLHGIWATAPYLHNGSVSSLYELLLPPEQRMKTFAVGSYEFDPEKVGYRTEPGDGTKVYDTRLPGNHNTGHRYGTNLSEAERWDLIVYLKSL